MTVMVQTGAVTTVARLDLRSRETVVHFPLTLDPARLTTTEYALRLSIDRQIYERGRQVEPQHELSYDLGNPESWTPMQRLAAMSGAWWYPPFPRPSSSVPESFRSEVRAAHQLLRSAVAARRRNGGT